MSELKLIITFFQRIINDLMKNFFISFGVFIGLFVILEFVNTIFFYFNILNIKCLNIIMLFISVFISNIYYAKIVLNNNFINKILLSITFVLISMLVCIINKYFSYSQFLVYFGLVLISFIGFQIEKNLFKKELNL